MAGFLGEGKSPVDPQSDFSPLRGRSIVIEPDNRHRPRKRRKKTSARGYGTLHQKMRRKYASLVASGGLFALAAVSRSNPAIPGIWGMTTTTARSTEVRNMRDATAL